MDGFRMKETHDILSLEELQEKVDTVNELYDTLEVSFFFFFVFVTLAQKWDKD